jgi:predicted RNase H-like HicB family nuclease
LLKLYDMKQVKIVIEKHLDGYVAYPVGVKGVVVGEGDTYEEALRDVQGALKFHIKPSDRVCWIICRQSDISKDALPWALWLGLVLQNFRFTRGKGRGRLRLQFRV